MIKSLGPSAVFGGPGGAAGPLDANGQIPASQIPAPNRVLAAFKPIITNRSSTTVLAADPHLTFAGVTAGTYEIEAFIAADAGSATPDIACGFSISQPPTSDSWVLGLASQEATTLNISQLHQVAVSPAGLAYQLTLADMTGIHFRGFVTVQLTSTIAFAWAQATSDLASTNVQRGSWMSLRRLGA